MPQMSEDDARLLDLANDSSEESDVPVDARCKYPSKYCGNARAAKSSGKLHRFCDFHRRRANVNQKRWTAVRRQIAREVRTVQQQQLDASLMDPTWASYYAATAPLYYGTDQQHHAMMNEAIPPHLVPAMEAIYKDEAGLEPLDENDIQILTSLLDDDDLEAWGLEDDAPASISRGSDEGQRALV